MTLNIVARDTGNLSQIQKPDYDEFMFLNESDNYSVPYFFKSLKDGKRTVINRTFKWAVDDEVPDHDYITTAATAAATTLTPANYTYFRRLDKIINVNTHEQMLVLLSASGAGGLTVTRGWGATAAAPIGVNDTIRILGSVPSEDSNVGDVRSTTETIYTNYVQEWETPLNWTEDNEAAVNYTGKDLPYQRKKAFGEHARKIGLDYWFGEPKSTTYNGAAAATYIQSGTGDTASVHLAMGGVEYFMRTYASATKTWNVGGSTTEAELISKLEEVFDKGSENKMAYAGKKWFTLMGKFKWEKVRYRPNEKALDYIVYEVKSPFGSFSMKLEKQLSAPKVGTPNCGDFLFVIDPATKNKYVEMMATQKETVETSNPRVKKEVIRTKASLEMRGWDQHFMAYGLTTA